MGNENRPNPRRPRSNPPEDVDETELRKMTVRAEASLRCSEGSVGDVEGEPEGDGDERVVVEGEAIVTPSSSSGGSGAGSGGNHGGRCSGGDGYHGGEAGGTCGCDSQTLIPVRLTRPDDGPSAEQNLWTLIRNRTQAISFNRYSRFLDQVLCDNPKDEGELLQGAKGAMRKVGDLSFLGLDGYEVVRAVTEYFLMHEVGLIVDPKLQEKYNQEMCDSSGAASLKDSSFYQSEVYRRGGRCLPENWVTELHDQYLESVGQGVSPKVLPYLRNILDRLRDLPTKTMEEVPRGCYGVLPARLVGPLGLELIWNYWHEEGMVVQTHNAITSRFQNLRVTGCAQDPLARLEIDPLRRINNILWGWIQNRPYLLSVRRRAYEYDHQYGITLLGKAVGEVNGADSRSQFLSAFHNLLHLCTTFYQQDDDLTVHSDGFPLLNALRETQLVVTAGAHNQYGDLPWTARVEMLLQMWLLGRPEMREFLGGRVMVPYKESWMDRVDSVKSMMGWSDVNVTHFRDLGVFGEQIILSIRYGSWMDTIEPGSAVKWARYWRPEIQGYLHAYRAATGVDLSRSVNAEMPSILLSQRLGGRDSQTAEVDVREMTQPISTPVSRRRKEPSRISHDLQ